ncbi:hypothetical protein [Actinoplanes sp. NPDC049599]|uniref:hypothetical protein n=1 Tax=Actinoplanes sp. NPDC049599 TaxID=3363903 RepID=UPI0037BD1DA1
MIDLDQPAQDPTPPHGALSDRWRRLATLRTLALIVVASFVAGALVGGLATYLGWHRPLAASVEADWSKASVLLFAEPDLTTAHRDQRRVRLETQVTVVNAGPETINVLAIRVNQPNVTLRSPEKERAIEPGTALPVDVVLEWPCTATQPTTLAATLTVETGDEQLRTISPVALDGTPWSTSSKETCTSSG